MLTIKGRVFVLKICFLLIFLVIVYRLFAIQVLDVFDFYGKYERYKNKRVLLPAERGVIYDRNGVPLSENKKLFKIELCPAIVSFAYSDSATIEDKKYIYERIAEIASVHTEENKEFYLKKIRSYAPSYPNGFEFIVNLDARTKEAILQDLEEENILGATAYPWQSTRVYPRGGLAGPLIGLYSQDGALCGIEQSFDGVLRGTDGWVEVVQYGTGEKYHFQNMNRQEPIPGGSVYLTIDTQIQSILEKNLLEGLKTYGAKNAIGIIISAKNGDILAMRGYSAVDTSATTLTQHANPILPISWLFEPGSSMKPLVALLALEKGLFQPDDIIDCDTRKVGSRTISDVTEHNTLTFKEVLTQSSNVGMTRVVDKLSAGELYSHLISCGFSCKTCVQLLGEESGLLRPLSEWSSFSKHSLSFGQEISVTAIQMVYAYATLANGGRLLYPNIVKEVKDNDGTVKEFNSQLIRLIGTQSALDTLKTILQAVVEEGLGKPAYLDFVNIAGKTGTGEKLKDSGPGYKEGKYVATFIGFFPVEDPEIVMLILFDEPTYKYRFGSLSCAPTFKKIVQEMVVLPNSHLLTHIKQINQKYILVPDCIGLSMDEVASLLSQQHIAYTITGDGSVVTDQFPKPGTTMLEDFDILLIANEENAISKM
jgi:cell division protein FtsI/penicillin-binding protein 2